MEEMANSGRGRSGGDAEASPWNFSGQAGSVAGLDGSTIGAQGLIGQIPVVTYVERVTGEDTIPLYVSPQIEWMLGIRCDAWLADPALWKLHLHPQDRERVRADYLRCLEGGRSWSGEYRMVGPTEASCGSTTGPTCSWRTVVSQRWCAA